MGITLYHCVGSPPCHAVRLAAKYLGVELELKEVDLEKGGQLKPEFLKMNPQHTVPTLDDNGFYLSESHAILPYLANAYGKVDSLYPKDPKARYLVDQRLAFNLGTLYQRFLNASMPSVLAKAPIDPANIEKLNEALQFTNAFLEKSKYIAGDQFTIADIAVLMSLISLECVNYDLSSFPAVTNYLQKLKGEVKGYDELVKTCADGLAEWFHHMNPSFSWK